MLILAIESSCDETSAAVVKDGRIARSNLVSSQVDIHALYGGVVPEIASRAHTEAITSVTDGALELAKVTLHDIDGIAVTYAPGLIGALLVGVNFAKSLAYAAGKPLIPVHHIRGHIAANYLYYNGSDRELLEPPFFALVVSGGHTSLLWVKDYTDIAVIGSTRDDAAGEAFDKAARLLGFTYPGGAKMDAAAARGNPNAFSFPQAKIKDHPYDFSFSGLKTTAVNLIHNANQSGRSLSADDFSASYTNAVVQAIASRVERLIQDPTYQVKRFAVAGGVSANSHLRKTLARLCCCHNVQFYQPPLSLCGDNAAMIGAQAYYEVTQSSFQPAPLSLNAYATKDVSDHI